MASPRPVVLHDPWVFLDEPGRVHRGARYLWDKLLRSLTKKAVAYHLFFWLGLYGFWMMFLRNYTFTLTRNLSVQFCYLVFITADYYLLSALVIPRLLLKRKYLSFVGAATGILLLSSVLRCLVARALYPLPAGRLLLDSAVNISLWVFLITGGKMLIDRLRHEQQLERLEREKVKTELEFLKAQVNPHALFNSLNTVYGHIDRHNKVARDTLLQFSELLRYQLYDCGADKVNLAREIGYIRNYIDFQRLRKNDRLVVEVDTTEVQPGLQIAPLLLIVLVENAFKFVSNFTDRENRITIRIQTRGKVLYVFIANTKESLQAIPTRSSNGIGIANLQRRLDLLYDRKHTYTTETEDHAYKTNLIIDLS
jgi:hypothetical protein